MVLCHGSPGKLTVIPINEDIESVESKLTFKDHYQLEYSGLKCGDIGGEDTT